MKRFTPCRKCGHKSHPRIPDGYYEETIKQNGQRYKVLVECDCHKRWQKEYDAFLLFKKNGFDEKTWDYQFTDYSGLKSKQNLTRLEKYVANFDNVDVKSAILYFWGSHGTQKTTTAHIVGKMLLQKGVDVQYITMSNFKDLFWAYANARDRDTKREQENDYLKIRNFEKIANCDLLILDDAFVLNLFPGGLVDVDNFIRERVKRNKGIIFISNFSIDELSESKTCSTAIKSFITRETGKQRSVFKFEDDYNDIRTENLF
jgi:DNA replication protein DnaC